MDPFKETEANTFSQFTPDGSYDTSLIYNVLWD
jgi:hypothetical protein